ncbi:lipase 3-like [Rhagoletis pomonella]|uniref:lipase 3-like n=1 Tax=Rhagoletis pomonella TaxID=28610 RepID=UPI00178216BA|nr:lipase 3-like [Rhagoletis pomonella]
MNFGISIFTSGLLLASVSLTAALTFDEERLAIKQFVTSEQRIRSHGYPTETHTVETSDGYLLTLFRIPYSHKLKNEGAYRPAILLQHGLFSNSDCWLSNGPDNSLAYLLVDAGFDVWLGNARGNIYSRANSKISLNSPKFWKFSWHEIGIYDISAMIDYIRDFTGQQAIHYAGHSQGTTVFLVLMSTKREYNARIKTAHLLAPCAFFAHGTHPAFQLSALVGTPGGLYNSLLEDMELVPKNKIVNRIVDTLCGQQPQLGKQCKDVALWYAGEGYRNTNMSSLQILIETHPGGSSSNQGIHFLQLSKSHKFRQFDYGTKKNRQVYNQDTPPDYDLSKITARTYLYSSANDALCGPRDVDNLVENMPLLVEDYRVADPTWNHMDFIVANQMKEVINARVVQAVKTYERFTQ